MRLYGFKAKCTSVRAININVEEGTTNCEKTLKNLTEQVKKMLKEEQTESIILAGTGLCDYDHELKGGLGFPVTDPVVQLSK